MHKTFLIIINCENSCTALVKTVISFSSGVLDEQKVQKNSIYNKSFVTIHVFTVTFDQFNVPLLNKSSNLISSKILTDLKPLNGSVRQNKITNSFFQIIFQPSMDLQQKFHRFWWWVPWFQWLHLNSVLSMHLVQNWFDTVVLFCDNNFIWVFILLVVAWVKLVVQNPSPPSHSDRLSISFLAWTFSHFELNKVGKITCHVVIVNG